MSRSERNVYLMNSISMYKICMNTHELKSFTKCHKEKENLLKEHHINVYKLAHPSHA